MKTIEISDEAFEVLEEVRQKMGVPYGRVIQMATLQSALINVMVDVEIHSFRGRNVDFAQAVKEVLQMPLEQMEKVFVMTVDLKRRQDETINHTGVEH